MQTDILLLGEVFEAFSSSCPELYGSDPAHYMTLPSYTFDAMLLCTGVELELLTEIDMFVFIEKGKAVYKR